MWKEISFWDDSKINVIHTKVFSVHVVLFRLSIGVRVNLLAS